MAPTSARDLAHASSCLVPGAALTWPHALAPSSPGGARALQAPDRPRAWDFPRPACPGAACSRFARPVAAPLPLRLHLRLLDSTIAPHARALVEKIRQGRRSSRDTSGLFSSSSLWLPPPPSRARPRSPAARAVVKAARARGSLGQGRPWRPFVRSPGWAGWLTCRLLLIALKWPFSSAERGLLGTIVTFLGKRHARPLSASFRLPPCRSRLWGQFRPVLAALPSEPAFWSTAPRFVSCPGSFGLP